MKKEDADRIIKRFFKKIYGFAVKKSFSQVEADDLCGEMVAQVYLSLLSADKVYNLEGWIWRICQHTFAKYLSSKKVEGISLNGLVEGGADFARVGSVFDSGSENSEDGFVEEISRLRREIGFLTEERRKILYSFYFEGKSLAAIGSETGLVLGTVKWHLNRARIDLKEGFNMERKVGNLGINPVFSCGMGHSGRPGKYGGPEFYLNDRLNLNIVYSVYDEPKTREDIAEELGMTPVFLDERIALLESNGFLTRTSGKRYTTYVKFISEALPPEMQENILNHQLELADELVEKYVPIVRKTFENYKDVEIPGGNFELFLASLIFYGISDKSVIQTNVKRDKYRIKTLDGGDYHAMVWVDFENSKNMGKEKRKEGRPSRFFPKDYNACGSMTRSSQKYPGLFSWSVDSRLCSRKGGWQNNLDTDLEALYEVITGAITETSANKEKFDRLRERNFITADGKSNVIIVHENADVFFAKIPAIPKDLLDKASIYALETGNLIAKKYYPKQMQDLAVSDFAQNFIGYPVAIMVLDKLYETGIFRPLTEDEKASTEMLVFVPRNN